MKCRICDEAEPEICDPCLDGMFMHFQEDFDRVKKERDELRRAVQELHESGLAVYGPGEANREWWDEVQRDARAQPTERSDG